jgi:Fe-S-cluster containining protein
MFSCNHNGQCCEDPVTQISLTLADLKRICIYTHKTALQLYKEGMIGVFPFGDLDNNGVFERDIGLYIPCKNRVVDKKTKHKSCGIYPVRPLNCRMFPFWLLADAPLDVLSDFQKNHKCGICCGIDENFENDRKKYKAFKDALAKVLVEEAEVSDKFFESIGVKKEIHTSKSYDEKDTLIVINDLVKELEKIDFSEIFSKIDKELETILYRKAEDIPQWDNFR